MSGRARGWLEAAKNAVEAVAGIVGPAVSRAASEMGGELKRLGTHGSVESGSGLITGNWFIPYGPGAYTPSAENQQKHEQEHGHER